MENHETLKLKYTAFKIKGFNYLIWFEQEKVEIDSLFYIIGKDGWGKDGAKTNINIRTELVEGQIWSDTLQYG